MSAGASPSRSLHAADGPAALVRPDGVARGDELVGRAVELASLLRFVDDGHEPALLLAGPRGSGRTRLLRRLRRCRPDRVLLVRGLGATARSAWSGMAAVLAAIEPAAVDDVLGPVADRAPDRAEVVRRTLALLADRPGEPPVLVVDDVDTHDEPSREALALLAEHLGDTGVQVLASVVWPPVTVRFTQLPLLRLDPLGEDDLRRVLPLVTTRRVEPVTADLLVRFSGGLPGALAAHLEQRTPAQRDGRAPLTVPLPPAFPDETGIAQLRFRLDAEDWQVLQRIATAPAVSLEAVGALVGPHLGRLDALIARGVLSRERGYVFLPLPELRSQLYWELTPAARAAAHVAAAEAESRSDPDLHDWHRSHVAPDSTSSASLYAAATSLLRKGMPATALELAERALSLTGVGLPVQQQLEFARELLLHGSPGLARRHLPHDRAAMSRRQTFQRVSLDLVARAFTDELGLEAVDALVGRYRIELPDECADLLALAGVLLIMDGAVDDGVWRIRTAGVLSSGGPDEHSLHHWAQRLCSALMGGATEDAAARDRVLPDADVETRLTAALALMWEERYATAREHFAIVLNGWRGARSPWADRALTLATENEIRAGDLARALDAARAMESAGSPPTAHERVLLAWLAAAQDRGDDAEQLLRSEQSAAEPHRRRLEKHALDRVRGMRALLQGDLAVAIAWLRDVVDATTDLNPAMLRAHPDLVEALWRAGDVKGARAVTDRLAEAVAATPSRWGELALGRCRAMLAEDVEAAFTGLLVAFEPGELPFERARAHAVYALAADRSGLRDRAAEERRVATEAFRRLGATGWLRPLRTETAPAAGARPDLPVLTDTELAVLRMARQGAHNREIAAALFMSLRTVELRLTHIYRKFGARSRTHLFSLLPDDWPDGRRSGR